MVRLIDLQKIVDKRGNLSFIESNNEIPFNLKRVFWVYDVPGEAERNGHAYKEQHEAIVLLTGSLRVIVHDGSKEHYFELRKPNQCLYLPPLTWRKLKNFTTNTVTLHLSSSHYLETDYIRQKVEFLKLFND